MYKESLIARLSKGLEGEELNLFQEAAALCESTEEMSLADVLMELREGGVDMYKAIISESVESEEDEVESEEDEVESEEDEVESEEDVEEDVEDEDVEIVDEEELEEGKNPDDIKPVSGNNSAAVIYKVHSRNKNKMKEDVTESYSDVIRNRIAEIGKIDEKYNSIESEDVSVNEDVTAMFEGSELSEEFKEKATIIFEAAVARQVDTYKELVNEAIDDIVEEEISVISEGLTEKIDGYLDYVVEEWIKENQLAIETGLRNEIAEDFIEGLKTLFTEHYIEVPEGKENILDTVVDEKQAIEEEFEKAVQKNIELIDYVKSLQKSIAISESSEGLAVTEAEKFAELAEGVEFESIEDFTKKIAIIKESYFSSKAPSVDSSKVIDERGIIKEEVEVKNIDPKMASYVSAMEKYLK